MQLKHVSFAMRHIALYLVVCCHLLLVACGGGGSSSSGGGAVGGGDDSGGDGDEPEGKPTIAILFPPADGVTSSETIMIRGTSGGDHPVEAVRINDKAANLPADSTEWSLQTDLQLGENLFTVEVEDENGFTTTETVSISRSAPLFSRPTAIDVDSITGRTFVLDYATRALYEIDLDTGEKAVLSGTSATSGLTGDGPGFAYPVGFDVSLDGTIAYVADQGADAVVAVNLGSGARNIISGKTGGDDVGAGPHIELMADVAVDSTGSTLYAFDSFTSNIFSVDLANGDRAIPVEDDSPDPVLNGAWGLEWNPDSSELWLPNMNGTMVTADPASGLKESLTLSEPAYGRDLALDRIDGRVFVAGATTGRTYVVDIGTGSVQVLSEDGGPGAGPALLDADAIAWHESRNKVLVVDRDAVALVGIDPDSGDRTVISDSEEVRIGSGTRHDEMRRLATVDTSERYAYVADGFSGPMLKIDLATGKRATLVTDFDLYDEPEAFVDDKKNDRLIMTTGLGGRLVAINKTDGALTYIGSMDIDGIFHDGFSDIGGMVFDSESDIIYFSSPDDAAVYQIDLETLHGTVLSDASTGNGAPLRTPAALALDIDGSRLLVADEGPTEVVAIDLSTGDRSTFVGTGSSLRFSIQAMSVDSINKTLHLAELYGDLHEASLLDGDIKPFAGTARGTGPAIGRVTGLTADVEAGRDIIWYYDWLLYAMVAVDGETGDRVIISR